MRTLAFVLALCATGGAWAATVMTNPVTGETESYDNVFTGGTEGTGTGWNSSDNWDTSTTPFITATYSPALVTNKTVSTSTAIDGWTLRVGAYNGAQVTWSGGIKKIQAGSAGCWLTADETSSITIDSFAGNQLEGSDSAPFKLTSQSAGGITWSAGLTAASNTTLPFWYYLSGNGTVVYGGDITIANAQVIKQADITLSGTSQVASKTLVTFGSGTTKTFTADATIKIKNGDTVLKTVYLNSITSSSTTLTGSEAVGTCELVQTSTGIVLYWVDGSAESVTGYKRSININFTNGNGLTTTADVGLTGYAAPGTTWNNFTIPNNANAQTFSSVKSIDSTGAASVESGVTVIVDGHRGSYSCSDLTAASNPLHGYIDEGAEKATPTVKITGIPYDHYRVIVYHSTDTANLPFGYDTINGFNFTYDRNGAQTTGTSSWGSSGADKSANDIAEGGNTLVSAVLSGDTVTMVAHRIGGATPTARGCFAAIQVVEYIPEAGDDDLEIEVDGDTNHEVTSAEATKTGTVYLKGSGTLTLSGENKISASTIDVGKNVVLNINADRLDATKFTGAGTVVYNNALPVTDKGWTSIEWSGTVWINGKSGVEDFKVNDYGNAGSSVKLSGVDGWVSAPGNYTFTNTVPVILENGTYNYALKLTNGNSPNDSNPLRCTAFAKVSGSGTITDGNAANPMLKIYDASDFTGTITLTRARVVFCSATSTFSSEYQNDISTASVYIDNGNSVTVPAGKTWTASNGFVVNGTLNANGTLASSHASKAVSGSGTVVFNGKVPSPNSNAWWKNTNWTGTLVMKNTTSSKSGDPGWDFDPTLYGNSNSTFEYENVALHFKSGTINCTVPTKVSGTGLTINNGYGGSRVTFSKLLGDGQFACNKVIEPAGLIRVLDWSGFTGYVNFTQQNLCFGSDDTITDDLHLNGRVFIGTGAVVTNLSSTAWTASQGFYVNGELCASGVGKFNNTISTSDTGIFTLIDSNDTQDHGVDYARIAGTGTLRYADVSGKWRSLSRVNFPTNMICENNLSSGLILQASGHTHTIGSLAGSGQIRSDWGGSGNTGDRDLKILQAKNTTYSGVFASSNDRVRDVYVCPGVSSAGTLTLSGTQTASNGLIVESGAKVKVTGKWVGATTVNGLLAFGGTNGVRVQGDVTTASGAELDYRDFTFDETAPINGNLTLNSGTTFKFPAGQSFPCRVASEIGGTVLSIDTNNYYIGESKGTKALKLTTAGWAYQDVSTTCSGNTAWTSLSWNISNFNGASNMNGVECSVSVTDDATLTLGESIQSAVSAGKVVFHVPANKTLTLTGIIGADEIWFTGEGKVICREANTLTGVIKGDSTITVEYPEHIRPATNMSTWTDDDWAGTLVLNNCGHLATTPEGSRVRVPFESYGSQHSKIKAPGFKGFAATLDATAICQAELIIDAGTQVELNHGWRDDYENEDEIDIFKENDNAGFRFRKISGAGKLKLDGTTDFAQYIFCDVDGFAGDVEITRPESGGRKSFLFGADAGWGIQGSAYPANLVIAGGKTIAVGENKTWDIPAGTIIDTGATLVLNNNSTNTVVSPRSTGTLKVSGSASAAVTNIMDSVLKANLDIGTGATLNIADKSHTSLTIPADTNEATKTYTNNGTLDLSGSSSLKELHLTLGESKDFDFTNVTLPSTCKEVFYDVGDKRDLSGYTLAIKETGTLANVTNVCFYATETESEYANGGFIVSNATASVDVWLIRQNGALIKTAVSNGTDSVVYHYYAGGSSFAGAACWHEWDFEQTEVANKLQDSGACTTNGSTVVSNELATAVSGEITYQEITVSGQEPKKAIPSSFHPYASKSLAFPADGWSAAVRCTMPEGHNKVGITFGDTENGILGLASGDRDGYVDLFNWTNEGGGKYTPLAQLQVESATNKMHIYVFTVTQEESKNYVSFYRDGEFIHSAEFKLNEGGVITNFMVGASFGSNAKLPREATDGYVDYIRLYDRILPESDIMGLSRRRPFVSAIDLYERTLGLTADWSQTGAWTWTKANGAGTANATVPTAGANVVVATTGNTLLGLNIGADVTYGSLIFEGTGDNTLAQNSTGRIAPKMFVVRSGVDLSVDYDAVDLTDSIVGVDPGAELVFNMRDFPYGQVTATTNITLIANVPDSASRALCSVSAPDKPAYITSVEGVWDGATYKVTITPSHNAGTNVYYKEGALTGSMDVYLDSGMTGTTTQIFKGDKVNVTSGSSGEVSVDATFNGDLVVNRTTLSITPAGEDPVLDGRTITVADGCTVTFKSGTYGALTLAGTGTFVFDGDVTVASLSGSVGITVADGATLTLDSITPFISGSVSGTGTVKLPAVTGSIDFNTYGNATNTVEVTGVTGGELTNNGTCAPTLLISRAAEFSTVGTYTFTKITGSGNLTFPSGSAVTISNLADYTGTIVNNSTTGVAVDKLYLNIFAAAGGHLLLAKSGTVTVSEVYVNDVKVYQTDDTAWMLADKNDGVYRASAKINETTYATLPDAISAAGDNLDTIVVLDEAAKVSEEYSMVDGVSGKTIAVNPTEYTWAGASGADWSTAGNWQYTVGGIARTATRVPGSEDTVIFGSAATVSLSGTVSAAELYCDASVAFTTGSSATLTVREGKFLLRGAEVAATISRNISYTTPKSGVYAYGVNEAIGETNNEYTLFKKPGTIFSVY